MYSTPQFEPVTTLVRNHKALLEKLKDGPVFLTQRGNEAAVIVSAAEWRAIVNRLDALEQAQCQTRLERSNREYAAIQADPTLVVDEAEYQHFLSAAGLSVLSRCSRLVCQSAVAWDFTHTSPCNLAQSSSDTRVMTR